MTGISHAGDVTWVGPVIRQGSLDPNSDKLGSPEGIRTPDLFLEREAYEGSGPDADSFGSDDPDLRARRGRKAAIENRMRRAAGRLIPPFERARRRLGYGIASGRAAYGTATPMARASGTSTTSATR